MSQFIESIKVENQKTHLLDLHQDRVNRTFAYFGHENPIDLKEIFQDLKHDENGLYKLRIVYNLQRQFRTQMVPYAFPQIQDFQLVENNLYDYSFKFEDRKEIEKMKSKAYAEEIIIVKNNHITDSSSANLLFLKDKQWYTPNTYLLNGVQRQHLLQTKKIKEIDITLQNIKEFTHFQIINSMNTWDNDFIYPIERIVNLPGKAQAMEY